MCLERLTTKACPPGKNWECSCCCPGKPGQPEAKVEERRATAFFKHKLAPWTFRARYVLIGLSLTLLAGGIAVNATMFTDGELKWFPPAHPLQKISDIADDDFGSAEDTKLQTIVICAPAQGRTGRWAASAAVTICSRCLTMLALLPVDGMASTSVSFPKSTDLYQAAGSDGFGEGYIERFDLQFSSSFTFGPAQQEKLVAGARGTLSLEYVFPYLSGHPPPPT